MGLFEKKKTVTLKIGGMHCEKCAAKVESALKTFGSAKVDLKLGRATLTCPEKTALDDVKRAVSALGFSCDLL